MTRSAKPPRIRIPVRLVDGVWECTFGGGIPVKDATEAELVVSRDLITDAKFLAAMEQRGSYRVLDEGTTLLVCLSTKADRPPPGQLEPYLVAYNRNAYQIATEFLDSWAPTSLAFVEVQIAGADEKQALLFETEKGGLWLITEGVAAVAISSTAILLPKPISPNRVASLNHAYTKLSEIFEPWRISHTGNIYSRILYKERNNKWYPLDILRNRSIVKQEHEIAQTLWDDFMKANSSKGDPKPGKSK